MLKRSMLALACLTSVFLGGGVGATSTGATPGAAHAGGAIHLTVKSLRHPCGKSFLVGTFAVRGLTKGRPFTVFASFDSVGDPLTYSATAAHGRVTLRHVRLVFDRNRAMPRKGSHLSVTALQNARTSRAVRLTLGGCH